MVHSHLRMCAALKNSLFFFEIYNATFLCRRYSVFKRGSLFKEMKRHIWEGIRQFLRLYIEIWNRGQFLQKNQLPSLKMKTEKA